MWKKVVTNLQYAGKQFTIFFCPETHSIGRFLPQGKKLGYEGQTLFVKSNQKLFYTNHFFFSDHPQVPKKFNLYFL